MHAHGRRGARGAGDHRRARVPPRDERVASEPREVGVRGLGALRPSIHPSCFQPAHMHIIYDHDNHRHAHTYLVLLVYHRISTTNDEGPGREGDAGRLGRCITIDEDDDGEVSCSLYCLCGHVVGERNTC